MHLLYLKAGFIKRALYFVHCRWKLHAKRTIVKLEVSFETFGVGRQADAMVAECVELHHAAHVVLVNLDGTQAPRFSISQRVIQHNKMTVSDKYACAWLNRMEKHCWGANRIFFLCSTGLTTAIDHLNNYFKNYVVESIVWLITKCYGTGQPDFLLAHPRYDFWLYHWDDKWFCVSSLWRKKCYTGDRSCSFSSHIYMRQTK